MQHSKKLGLSDIQITSSVDSSIYRTQFFELSLDMLCVASFDGYLLKLNSMWEQKLGWTVEEICSRPLIDFVHPDDREETRKRLLSNHDSKSILEYENRYLCKDGTYRWLSWRYVFKVEEKVVVASARDITKLKVTQRGLTDAQKIAKVGSWEWDIKSNVVTWSEQQYELFGRIKDSPIDYSVYLTHLSPEEKVRTEAIVRDCLEGKGDYRIEHEITRLNGEKRTICEVGSVEFDEAGNPIRMYGTSQDITREKLIENQIIHKEKLLSEILEYLPVAVFAKDIQNDFRWKIWNRKSEQLFGIQASECLGKQDSDYFPPDQAAFFRAKDLEASQSPEIIDIPDEPANTPIGVVSLHTKKVVIYDEKAKPHLLLGISEDITEMKKAQAKMIASAKMASLGEMAAGIAHEINNPLAIIGARACQLKKTISKGTSNTQSMISGLTKIEETVMRIARIVSGLKTFSRNSEADPMETTKISKIIDDTIELCSEGFKFRGIDLRIRCERDFLIQCRPTQISQVLMNLLGNAQHAVESLSEKWVEVAVTSDSGRLCLSVTDSGLGISTEIVEKMMFPFFTTKEVGKGTGLGLSISRGIIEEHSGELNYDASSLNTRFVVYLPILSLPSEKFRDAEGLF